MSDARLFAPSAARNRTPILEALRPHLPTSGTVLEIASGTGEHVAHFAEALPDLIWQPSDPEPERRASIDAWTAAIPNVRPAPSDAAISANSRLKMAGPSAQPRADGVASTKRGIQGDDTP